MSVEAEWVLDTDGMDWGLVHGSVQGVVQCLLLGGIQKEQAQ